MNKNILIAIAVAVPFMGYILFSESFNENPGSNDKNEQEIETTTQLPNADEQLSLVPEGYRRLDDYTIVIDVAVLPGTLQEIWVIYGTDANNLSKETPHSSSELGMGTAGEYGLYSLTIAPSKLEPGMSYFYKVVGETIEGEILHSGLNRFTAGK